VGDPSRREFIAYTGHTELFQCPEADPRLTEDEIKAEADARRDREAAEFSAKLKGPKYIRIKREMPAKASQLDKLGGMLEG
jgi:hypothetical protein